MQKVTKNPFSSLFQIGILFLDAKTFQVEWIPCYYISCAEQFKKNSKLRGWNYIFKILK